MSVSQGESPFEFKRLYRASFVARPNRFLVRCRLEGGGSVNAFLPNPGRLWELLFPDTPLWLAKSDDLPTQSKAKRKTQYTVLAVERDNSPVFLHTHLTNQVARWLIERRRIHELGGAQLVRAEVPVGSSRFDFLLRLEGQDFFLEVKSCTLFGNSVAMFPDAVTDRGRRHLNELASLRRSGVRTGVLFLVHTQDVQWFMPDYHTDLAFSQTLLELRKQLQIIPVSLARSRELVPDGEIKRLKIPWDYLQREVHDRGSYLLLLRLDRRRRIEVGRLGRLLFPSGYYIYVGSAQRNLNARVARHTRLRKKHHWHIDYLRQHADRCVALPIRSSRHEECQIAGTVATSLDPGPLDFGSSDCHCPTHLFWQKSDPLQSREFHRILQQFRMRAPE